MTKTKYCVLHMLPDLQVGGGQQLLLRLITAMRQAGKLDPGSEAGRFEHIVGVVKPMGDMEPQFIGAGAEVVRLNIASAGSALAGLRRLGRCIRGRGVDLIHTNNTGPDRLFGQIAAMRWGKPVINTLHAEPPPTCTGEAGAVRALGLGGRVKCRVRDRMTGATTRRFVAVSRRMKEAWGPYVRGLGANERDIDVVIAGLATDGDERGSRTDAALLRAEIAGAGSWPVLMYVARIVPGKGHEHLVPLMARVLERHPGAVLVLVGDGESRPWVERAVAEAGLGDRVRFLGQRKDVAALLAACDLFVFPSLSEGFGLAVLEAMAAGKPVVAFDLPAFGEFVQPGATAVLAAPGDGGALTDAALGLLADPARMEAMGTTARRVVAERFTIRASVEALARIYLEVLEGPKR